MESEVAHFSHWLTLTHFFNFLLLTLLVRSGFQILSDHPRLYWNDHCTPGSEWIKFTKAKVPRHRPYTSMDDAVPISAWLGLPGGRHSLGLGRHWHFFTAFLWGLNGLIYVVLLFATNHWRALIPTSWEIFPEAWHAFLTYLSFHLPDASQFHPYEPLQQLSYAFIVFICAPLSILTGMAMSPAFIGRFPWFPKLFGGRQASRSIHFILVVIYTGFFLVHVTLVAITGLAKNLVHIVLGRSAGDGVLALWLTASGLLAILAIHVAVTLWSRRSPRQVQKTIGASVAHLMQLFFSRLKSRQHYAKKEISPYHWVNGYPPETKEWLQLAKHNFREYHLEVRGLVERPCFLSLEELKKLPKASQTVMHNCIQGWTGIAEWSGVPLSEIIRISRPLPKAQFVIFHSYQLNPQEAVDPEKLVEYYGSLTMEEALAPQTLLAYEMNGEPLPIPHGAPLRLRMETKLGFKMVKWIKSIEFVETYSKIGEGQGGYREDQQYYNATAQI